MNEIVVRFSPNELDAEVAAGALRAGGLHPRLARDDASLGIAGTLSVGRFVVLVPEHEAKRAREILHEPNRHR